MSPAFAAHAACGCSCPKAGAPSAATAWVAVSFTCRRLRRYFQSRRSPPSQTEARPPRRATPTSAVRSDRWSAFSVQSATARWLPGRWPLARPSWPWEASTMPVRNLPGPRCSSTACSLRDCLCPCLVRRIGVWRCAHAGIPRIDGYRAHAGIPKALAGVWRDSFDEWCAGESARWWTERPQKNAKRERILVGGCACGGCRFRALCGSEFQLQHCYCNLCRKFSGSVAQTWVPVHSDKFEWTTRDTLQVLLKAR